MNDCTDCILDLTDACPRGSGRAIDDEICDSFISRETYQVNKNESWKLGFQQGRADVIEPLNAIIEESEKMMWSADKTLKKIKEQLKEQDDD